MERPRIEVSSERTRAEIALLLDFYGSALTERQRQTAELYFQEDLSLAEIAEMTGITRQGVRDGLKKAETALYRMENDLGIAARFLKQKRMLEEARREAQSLPDGDAKSRLLELIGAMLEEI